MPTSCEQTSGAWFQQTNPVKKAVTAGMKSGGGSGVTEENWIPAEDISSARILTKEQFGELTCDGKGITMVEGIFTRYESRRS